MASQPLDIVHQPGRAPWSGRRRVVSGLGVAALVAMWFIADHEASVAEEHAIQRCTSDARVAMKGSTAAVDALVSYIRPTLETDIKDPLRQELYAMVAERAIGHDTELVAARKACDSLQIWATHGALRQRRAACSAQLAAYVDLVNAIADDGHAAMFARPAAEGCSP
jgi:hypothetical protein